MENRHRMTYACKITGCARERKRYLFYCGMLAERERVMKRESSMNKSRTRAKKADTQRALFVSWAILKAEVREH